MSTIQLILPLILLELVLKAVALTDLSRRSSSQVKGGVRWLWALIILFVSTIGPALYLIWGRDDSIR